jgi:hypothetical protein
VLIGVSRLSIWNNAWFMKKRIIIQVLKNTLRNCLRLKFGKSRIIQYFLFAHQNILIDMLEVKIAFQELDLLALIVNFENHKTTLINVVAESLFCLSTIRDKRRRMKLKAAGHVYKEFI